MRAGERKPDLTGTFGRLTILRRAPEAEDGGRSRMYRCRCECGQEKVVRSEHLVRGSTKSCGCIRRERYWLWQQTRRRNIGRPKGSKSKPKLPPLPPRAPFQDHVKKANQDLEELQALLDSL